MTHGVEVHLQHSGMAPPVELVKHADHSRVGGVAAQQNGAACNVVLRAVGDEVLRRTVELAPGAECVATRPDALAHPHEPFDRGAPDHGTHPAVQLPVGHGAEGNIRHDEHLAAVSGYTRQVIERHRQRIGVRIVHIGHDNGTGDPLPHAEPDGHGTQRRECGRDRSGRHAHRIVESGHEGFVATRHLLLVRTGEQALVRHGIAQLRAGGLRPQRLLHQRFAAAIDDAATRSEQLRLLPHLLPLGLEVLAVFRSQVGEDAHVGTDDGRQPLHLARTRYARLDEGDLLVAGHHQDRKRHPQLGVITAGAAEERHPFRSRLGDPLLHRSLAARPGNTHHRSAERQPIVRRQGLQPGQRFVHTHEAGTRIVPRIHLALHHEAAHAPPIEVGDIIMPVVVAAPDRHEQRGAVRGHAAPAVGHHAADGNILAAERALAYRGDLAYRILHNNFISPWSENRFIHPPSRQEPAPACAGSLAATTVPRPPEALFPSGTPPTQAPRK